MSGRPQGPALRQAVAGAASIAEVLRLLGMPDNWHRRAWFRKRVEEDGLDVSHFRGQAHARGRPGPVPPKPASEILVRHEGVRRTRTVLLRRALAESGVPDRCDECGTPPLWAGLAMTLEVDHVNGDRTDDRLENLRLLCPNCHAVTRTWCRGGGSREAG